MAQDSSKKNTYQLSGVDDHERGFSRQVEVSGHQGLFQAVLRYEKLFVSGEPCPDEDTALRELIQKLQGQGYTQLRTQLIFQETRYLGSQEMWVDYPDQDHSTTSQNILLQWLRRCFGIERRTRKE